MGEAFASESEETTGIGGKAAWVSGGATGVGDKSAGLVEGLIVEAVSDEIAWS
jgi:hypothetical protein